MSQWVYSFLLLKLIISEAAIIFPASPCDRAFTYEDDSTAGDRWYGELVVVPSNTVTGLTLRVALDRPSQLLVVSEMYFEIYRELISVP